LFSFFLFTLNIFRLTKKMNTLLPIDAGQNDSGKFQDTLTKESFYFNAYLASKGKKVYGRKKRYFIYSRDGRLPSITNTNQPITFIIDRKGEIDFLTRLRLCTTLKFSVDDSATDTTFLPGLPIFMIRKIE